MIDVISVPPLLNSLEYFDSDNDNILMDRYIFPKCANETVPICYQFN